MLEDTKAALSDLDKVTVFFRPLEDECLVASKRLRRPTKRPSLMSSCMVLPTLNKVPLCQCTVAIEGEIALFPLQITFSLQWRVSEIRR